ncbi:putative sulfurylase large subunit (molybdopterin cytosine dinucleotide biosynthesis) [Breoghania corrubedonensis]|uniref:Putative sulfurylase large subunit (Molybdopterin cytosine dinucleotide biosynthesis) n=1 Tax=Breoghania corrubedonensis TaxID=665038 RepID=A0A2T5VG85_9HYPH|nr:XdhC family protein [Breoghania corrubedonensis]PTW62767.1 putative sulfurylase large subunit (molybdopterin cytosine dinucleotide biosynthesis) [Breoghania corrubedonensis]
MDLALLKQLNRERAARRGCILVSEIATGAQRLVLETDDTSADPLAEEFAARFRSGKSGMVSDEADGQVFLNVSVPPPRLVVIGAVHISQALTPIAAIAGFDMEIIDPRTAFASPERFPDVPLHAEWPEDVIPRKVSLDRYTALAALTHDPKIDDYPLIKALSSGCFYVGALGSRKTHASRVERLTKAGASEADLARIKAPIGVNIGAASPAEIAVAVMAQIIEELRKGARASVPAPVREAMA